ncbi:MAG: hypothetical protein WKF59_24975 [Chitinophagaceae bacterium]
MNIYVGNLSWQMTDDDLSNLFTEHGTVTSAKILKEKIPAEAKVSVLLKWKMMKLPKRQLQH